MTTAAERAMEMASVAQSEATRNSQQGQALEQRVAALEQMTVDLWDRLERHEAVLNALREAADCDSFGALATLERIKRLEERLGMEP